MSEKTYLIPVEFDIHIKKDVLIPVSASNLRDARNIAMSYENPELVPGTVISKSVKTSKAGTDFWETIDVLDETPEEYMSSKPWIYLAKNPFVGSTIHTERKSSEIKSEEQK